MTVVDQAKELLGSPNDRIKLHDLVTAKIKELQISTSEEFFPVQGTWSADEFKERLNKYEAASKDLRSIMALLGYWGEPYNKQTLTLPISRLGARFGPVNGLSTWIDLRWYPCLLLMYSAGIGAIAAGKYENLQILFDFKLPKLSDSGNQETQLTAVVSGASHLPELFKQMPGSENQYVPRSEYIYNLLRSEIEDVLGFSEGYEYFFDRFEILLALEYAHLSSNERSGRIWGPPGRFAWKFQNGKYGSPYHRLISEAESEGDAWPVIEAGLFGGSLERFQEVTTEYTQRIERFF